MKCIHHCADGEHARGRKKNTALPDSNSSVFFPEPSQVKFSWRLFGFQMLFSLTQTQPHYRVQTCLHLPLVFLCAVDVLFKRPDLK